MKIRIRDNSIRLRLTRGEVETVRRDGTVAARTQFADGGRFAYTLESSPATVAPAARFVDGEIRIRLPESTVSDWADSGQVSIKGEQALDGGGTLTILVEKDFACLAPREGEDESDMYTHPQAREGAC